MMQFLESPRTSVGQSRSRCDFPLLVSALGSRDTPTCSEIQKHHVMFIVTTHATSPISTAPSLCSHFVPSGHRLLLPASNPQAFCLTGSACFKQEVWVRGYLPNSLQRVSPHCPSTNSFLITYSKARGKVGRGSLAHLIKATLRLGSFPSAPAINQKLKSEVALEWEHCRQLYTCCVQWHVLRWLSVAPIGWPPSKNGLPTDHTLNTAKSSMAGLGVAPTRK